MDALATYWTGKREGRDGRKLTVPSVTVEVTVVVMGGTMHSQTACTHPSVLCCFIRPKYHCLIDEGGRLSRCRCSSSLERGSL